jgi:hypothetical protein
MLGDVTGSKYVGGIAGMSRNTRIEDCRKSRVAHGLSNTDPMPAPNQITGTRDVGGITGRVSGSSSRILRSYSDGNIRGQIRKRVKSNDTIITSKPKHIGGIAGTATAGAGIQSCAALNESVTIEADKKYGIGRIIGQRQSVN